MQPIAKYKVSVIGPSNAGKTCIISALHNHSFDANTNPTIGAMFISEIFETSNGKIELHIWDTAGNEKYKNLIPMFFRGSSALIFVYDVTSVTNFEQVKEWCTSVINGEDGMFDLYLVGNKIDLKRKVNQQDAELFAKSINAIYFETSAKTGENISKLFNQVAENISYKQELANEPVFPPIEENRQKNQCC